MSGDEAVAIERTLGRIEQKLDGQCERIEAIETTLNHPKDGIVANMAVLTSQMSEVRGADESAKASKRWAVGAGVAGGGGIVAVVVQLLREVLGK
jgi:hypothetical protein